MAEKHRIGRDRLEEGLKFGAVVVDPDADQGLRRVLCVAAVANEIGRVAGPTHALENRPERIEAPGALIGPVQHDDVLGHGLRPLGRLACRSSRAGKRQKRQAQRSFQNLPAQDWRQSRSLRSKRL